MKNVITFSATSILAISLIVAGLFKTNFAAALTATTTSATSTAAGSSTPSTTDTLSTISASTTTPTTSTSSTPIVTTATIQTTPQTSQPVTSGKPSLKLVHVVGTKYVDYFTDGKKTYALAGDPSVDGKLNLPNAPTPFHSGLKWVSTSGMEAYDTTSGDLEVDDYAQEADGSYIYKTPAYTYTDATSSVAVSAHIAFSKTDPTQFATTSSTTTNAPITDAIVTILTVGTTTATSSTQ